MKKQDVWLFAGLSAAVAAACWPLLSYLADPDFYVYITAAREFLRGGGIYSTAWIDKPPFAAVYYALGAALFPDSQPAVVLLLWGSVMATAAIFFWGLRGINRQAAWAAALVTAALPFLHEAWRWPSTEMAGGVFMAGAFVLSLRCWNKNTVSLGEAAGLGVLCGAGFFTRQSSFIMAGLPLYVLVRTQGKLLSFAAGIAATAVAAGLLVLFADGPGGFSLFLDTVFLYPARYATVKSAFVVPKWTVVHAVLALLFLAAAFRSRFFPLAVAAFIGGAIAAVSPNKTHAHYWVSLLPFFGLAAFAGFEAHVERSHFISWTAVALLVAASAGVYGGTSKGERVEKTEELGHAIRDAAEPGATIFVTGKGSRPVYFFSGLRPRHFIFTDTWIDSYHKDILPVKSLDVQAFYRENPPDFLVVSRVPAYQAGMPSRQLVLDLIKARHYEKLPAQPPWMVYRLRSDASRQN